MIEIAYRVKNSLNSLKISAPAAGCAFPVEKCPIEKLPAAGDFF